MFNLRNSRTPGLTSGFVVFERLGVWAELGAVGAGVAGGGNVLRLHVLEEVGPVVGGVGTDGAGPGAGLPPGDAGPHRLVPCTPAQPPTTKSTPGSGRIQHLFIKN